MGKESRLLRLWATEGLVSFQMPEIYKRRIG
jgi:hypothetical protein